jgi:hypothetical protein
MLGARTVMQPGPQASVDLRGAFGGVAPHEILTHHRDTKSLKIKGGLQPLQESIVSIAIVIHRI